MRIIAERDNYNLSANPKKEAQKASLSMNYIWFTKRICTILFKEKGCLESLKSFFLTLFNWKWIKLKDSDLLINVNSLAKKLHIQPREARALAKSKEVLFDAVFNRFFPPFPAYDKILEKILKWNCLSKNKN